MPGLRKTSRRSNKHNKNQTRVRKQSRVRKQKMRRTQKQNKRQKRTLKGGETRDDRRYAIRQAIERQRALEERRKNAAVAKEERRKNAAAAREEKQEKAAAAREAARIQQLVIKNNEFFYKVQERMTERELWKSENSLTWKIKFFTENKLTKKDTRGTRGFMNARERYFMLLESEEEEEEEGVKLLIWYDMAVPNACLLYTSPSPRD